MIEGPTFIQGFKENPIFIALATLITLVAMVALLVAVILAAKRSSAGFALGLVAAGLGVLAIVAGAAGTVSKRAHTDSAVSAPGLSPVDRARITTYGYALAAYDVKYGAAVGAFPLLAGLAAALLARSRRRPV